MSGFEELQGAVDLGKALGPVLPEEVKTEDELWSDDVALGIVLADVDAAIAYEQSKNFTTNMEGADDLVRQYVRVRPWPNTDKPRSALGMPVVLEAIEKIMPVLYMALWGSGKDPFSVTARGKTKPDAAHAWQHILRWAVNVSDLKEGSRLTLKTALTYGFGAGTTGWKTEEYAAKKYRRGVDGTTVERDLEAQPICITEPTYENVNLKNMIFDASCPTQDVRKGRFFAKRIPNFTAYDLADFRDDSTYKNIPSDDELRVILATFGEPTADSMRALKGSQTREFQAQEDTKNPSKDPLQQPLEIIEYWTRDRIVTILQRKIVIRNEKNESGKLPIYSCAFIDILNSAFGYGVAKLLAGEQRLQQGVINSWIDSLALVLNPVYQLIKGMGAGSQNISIAPGKVIQTESELKPLVTPSVSVEAQGAIAASEERANRRVGAEGGTNMPTQALRTGTGVQAYQGDVVQRLQYFLEIFLNLVFVPVLKDFVEQCKDNLTPDQVNQILSEEDGKAYQGDILDFYNADLKFEIISGVKLTTRQAAAQAAPLLLQLVASDPFQQSLLVQKKKFDYVEFLEEWLELMGWDVDTLIVEATDEDMQRAQQLNPAAIKAQSDSQIEQQRHANAVDLVDAKGSVNFQTAVGKQVVKHVIEKEETKKIEEALGNG